MTRTQNVDLVRSIYADWERGDFTRVDWADSQIEFMGVGFLDSGRWIGPESGRQAFEGFRSTWEGYRVVVDEFRELDDDRILVLARRTGRGKMSGLELAQMRTEWATLFHVRAGKVTRVVVYAERDHAFADLGLQE